MGCAFMDNRVMMVTTTQRQIERAAENDLDAAQASMDAAEAAMAMAWRLYGLSSAQYRSALRACDRARANLAAALSNLERTTHDEQDT